VDADLTANAFNIDTVTISELLPAGYEPTVPEDDLDDRNVIYRGVPISDYALASTRKFMRKHNLDLSGGGDREVYRQMLRNGVMLTDAYARLFDQRRIRSILTFESHYVHGGIPSAVGHQQGVPAYSVGMGYRTGTIILGREQNRNPAPQFADLNVLQEYVDEPLTPAQTEWVENAVRKRAKGEDALYNYTRQAPKAAGFEDSETVVGVFTNVVWDASLEFDDQSSTIDDIFDWVTETIDAFDDRDDVTVVVKTHPDESIRGTNQSVAEWMDSYYSDLPDNVTVLYPDTEVNTYKLFEEIDVGAVYTSSVGWEMAFRGIPVVVGGDPYYHRLGFTYNPRSLKEYRELLNRVEELEVDEQMQRRAKRFAYFLLYEKGFAFSFFDIDPTGVGTEIQPVTQDEIKDSDDFDVLVKKVDAGEPVIHSSKEDIAARSKR